MYQAHPSIVQAKRERERRSQQPFAGIVCEYIGFFMGPCLSCLPMSNQKNLIRFKCYSTASGPENRIERCTHSQRTRNTKEEVENLCAREYPPPPSRFHAIVCRDLWALPLLPLLPLWPRDSNLETAPDRVKNILFFLIVIITQ